MYLPNTYSMHDKKKIFNLFDPSILHQHTFKHVPIRILKKKE